MNRAEIEKELKANERKVGPLERRRWKLLDQLNKAESLEFVESGIMAAMSWRLRIYELTAYLQYEPFGGLPTGKRWPEIRDKIIPYPHSHFEVAKGVTLNQDDGDITLTFDSVSRLRRFIKAQNLTIIEWRNLDTLLQKIRVFRSLKKLLEGGY